MTLTTLAHTAFTPNKEKLKQKATIYQGYIEAECGSEKGYSGYYSVCKGRSEEESNMIFLPIDSAEDSC